MVLLAHQLPDAGVGVLRQGVEQRREFSCCALVDGVAAHPRVRVGEVRVAGVAECGHHPTDPRVRVGGEGPQVLRPGVDPPDQGQPDFGGGVGDQQRGHLPRESLASGQGPAHRCRSVPGQRFERRLGGRAVHCHHPAHRLLGVGGELGQPFGRGGGVGGERAQHPEPGRAAGDGPSGHLFGQLGRQAYPGRHDPGRPRSLRCQLPQP